jgi:hypothetical protein
MDFHITMLEQRHLFEFRSVLIRAEMGRRIYLGPLKICSEFSHDTGPKKLCFWTSFYFGAYSHTVLYEEAKMLVSLDGRAALLSHQLKLLFLDLRLSEF